MRWMTLLKKKDPKTPKNQNHSTWPPEAQVWQRHQMLILFTTQTARKMLSAILVVNPTKVVSLPCEDKKLIKRKRSQKFLEKTTIRKIESTMSPRPATSRLKKKKKWLRSSSWITSKKTNSQTIIETGFSMVWSQRSLSQVHWIPQINLSFMMRMERKMKRERSCVPQVARERLWNTLLAQTTRYTCSLTFWLIAFASYLLTIMAMLHVSDTTSSMLKISSLLPLFSNSFSCVTFSCSSLSNTPPKAQKHPSQTSQKSLWTTSMAIFRWMLSLWFLSMWYPWRETANTCSIS